MKLAKMEEVSAGYGFGKTFIVLSCETIVSKAGLRMQSMNPAKIDRVRHNEMPETFPKWRGSDRI